MISILERTAEELKMLKVRRYAVKGIQIRMRMLETDAAGIGGFDLERPRVNDKNRKSGRYTVVEEREKLRQQECALKDWIEHIELALSQMHPEDQRILKVIYCENNSRGDAVRLLEEELHIGRSDVYRKRELALADLASRLGYIV